MGEEDAGVCVVAPGSGGVGTAGTGAAMASPATTHHGVTVRQGNHHATERVSGVIRWELGSGMTGD